MKDMSKIMKRGKVSGKDMQRLKERMMQTDRQLDILHSSL